MKNLKTFVPLFLGLIPFLLGWGGDRLMLLRVDAVYWLLPWLTAALWLYFGYLGRKLTGKTWLAVLLLNTPAIVDLLLLGIQTMRETFWLNAVGLWSQLFFLPLLSWGARISIWIFGAYEEKFFPAFCAAFLIMLVLSTLGSLYQKKVSRGL